MSLPAAAGRRRTGPRPMMRLMRRESSTVIVLAGEPDDALLGALSQSPNVSVARAPAPEAAAAGGSPAARPAWAAGALAMREAARRRSTYVVVPDDPLADVAAAWREMWAGPGGPDAVTGFELAAGAALTAWRDKQFELPDYYLVLASAPGSPAGPGRTAGPVTAARPAAARSGTARAGTAAGGAGAPAGPGTGPAGGGGPDLYLGPLAAVRPRRVAVVVRADRPGDRAAGLLDSLRGLEPGPWWPPLGELIDTARNFFAGGLTHPQLASI